MLWLCPLSLPLEVAPLAWIPQLSPTGLAFQQQKQPGVFGALAASSWSPAVITVEGLSHPGL